MHCAMILFIVNTRTQWVRKKETHRERGREKEKTEEFFEMYTTVVLFVFFSLSLSFCLSFFFLYLFCVIRDDNLVRHINLHAFVYYHYYCYYLLCLCILVDCIFRRLNYPPIYYSLSSTSSSSFQTIYMCVFVFVCVCVLVYLLSSWFSFLFERTRFICAIVCLVIVYMHWLIKTLQFSSIWFLPWRNTIIQMWLNADQHHDENWMKVVNRRDFGDCAHNWMHVRTKCDCEWMLLDCSCVFIFRFV